MGSRRHRQERKDPARCVRGFTLLELLVGIALFAMLSTLVLGGIRLGIRSWDAVAERSADSEQIRIVHQLLRRQLTGSLALAASSSGRWLLQFEGDSKSLRFVTEFPTYVAGGGAQMVILAAENNGGTKRLLLRWWPLHAADGAAPQDEAVLLPDLSNVEIGYFGAVDQNALPQWRDHWSGMRHPPQLIKIRVTNHAGISWPPLVVPLKVDAVRFYQSPAETPDSEGGVSPGAGAAASRGPEPDIRS